MQTHWALKAIWVDPEDGSETQEWDDVPIDHRAVKAYGRNIDGTIVPIGDAPQTTPPSRKFFDGAGVELRADGPRTIVGRASFYGATNTHGNVIARGAFAATLRATKGTDKWPLMLLAHDATRPIGVWTEILEDDRGLVVKGVVSKTPDGDAVLQLLRDRAFSGLSVGYVSTSEDSYPTTGGRIIKQADLWEVSLVSFPGDGGARVLGVADDDALSAVERLTKCVEDVVYVAAVRQAEAAITDLKTMRASGVTRGLSKGQHYHLVAQQHAAMQGHGW